jgi:hypothetical protein
LRLAGQCQAQGKGKANNMAECFHCACYDGVGVLNKRKIMRVLAIAGAGKTVFRPNCV